MSLPSDDIIKALLVTAKDIPCRRRGSTKYERNIVIQDEGDNVLSVYSTNGEVLLHVYYTGNMKEDKQIIHPYTLEMNGKTGSASLEAETIPEHSIEKLFAGVNRKFDLPFHMDYKYLGAIGTVGKLLSADGKVRLSKADKDETAPLYIDYAPSKASHFITATLVIMPMRPDKE